MTRGDILDLVMNGITRMELRIRNYSTNNDIDNNKNIPRKASVEETRRASRKCFGRKCK